MKGKMVYFESCNDSKRTEIMILGVDQDFEVYYRRPGYAYIFAFGLPYGMYCLDEALCIARSNINSHEMLFD